jgi:23S rRNA A2030 N6-methylase RlmJ
MARLHKISRHSSHKVSTTLSLEGKVLAIKKNVLNLINSYLGFVALLDRSYIVLMLVGSPWYVRCVRRNSDHAIVNLLRGSRYKCS